MLAEEPVEFTRVAVCVELQIPCCRIELSELLAELRQRRWRQGRYCCFEGLQQGSATEPGRD